MASTTIYGNTSSRDSPFVFLIQGASFPPAVVAICQKIAWKAFGRALALSIGNRIFSVSFDCEGWPYGVEIIQDTIKELSLSGEGVHRRIIADGYSLEGIGWMWGMQAEETAAVLREQMKQQLARKDVICFIADFDVKGTFSCRELNNATLLDPLTIVKK